MKRSAAFRKLQTSQRQLQSANGQPNRRAVITVLVLVVLLLMSLMVAQFIRRAVGDRRQMRNELMRQQTIQLAIAAENRTKRKLASDASFKGETWEIPAGVIHQTNSAQVVINVEDDSATIIARYPINSDLPIQVTKTIRLSK